MTKPRVTTADRLSNIIEVVELGRRSGLLTVERGSQHALEQGEVYFLQGRAIYALVEGLRGREALSVLAGWGQCRFAFETNVPAPAPNIAAPQPIPPAHRGSSAPSQQNGAYAPPPQRAQPTPPRSAPAGYNWDIPASRPLPEPQTPASHTSAPNGPQSAPHTGALSGALPFGAPPSPPIGAPPSIPSAPSSAGASRPSSWPGAAGGQNTSGQLSWSTPGATPPASTGPFSGSGPFDAQMLQRCPRRAPDVRDLIAVVNSYNLSRNHRTILLLADGEHTVLDLARLSSKHVEEVVSLLADLERRGLVYYY